MSTRRFIAMLLSRERLLESYAEFTGNLKNESQTRPLPTYLSGCFMQGCRNLKVRPQSL